MKSGISVCVLVVLVVCACDALSTLRPPFTPVLLTGNCKLEELPMSIRYDCRSIDCVKEKSGHMSWTSNLCGWFRCGAGSISREIPANLTKTYPDCCPQTVCEYHSDFH